MASVGRLYRWVRQMHATGITSSCHGVQLTLARQPVILATADPCRWGRHEPQRHSSSQPHKGQSFRDLQAAYGGHKTSELVRATLVFGLCSFDKLVDNQTKLLRWSRRLLGSYIWQALMKRTIYGQFLAGETREEVLTVSDNLCRRGVTPWMTFTAKEIHGAALGKQLTMEEMKAYCQNNYNNMLTSLEYAADCMKYTNDRCKASTKVTSFVDPLILKKLSVHIKRTILAVEEGVSDADQNRAVQFGQLVKKHGADLIRQKPPFHVLATDEKGEPGPSGNIQSLLTNMTFLLTFSNEAKRHGIIEMEVPDLTENDMEQAILLWNRIKETGQRAKDLGVWMNLDAEQTAYQPTIETMALDCKRIFNKEMAVMNTTYQCYLKRTRAVLLRDLELSEREGFCLGCKIVRGAYMEEERRVCLQDGYDDPVNPTYDATTEMYYATTDVLLEAIKQRPRGAVQGTFATHNADTVEYIINKCGEIGVELHPESVSFAQLIGMRDYISFSLASAKIPVAKLLHYGTVEEGMAVMSRRVQENRAGLPTAQLEREMCWRELRRRLTRKSG